MKIQMITSIALLLAACGKEPPPKPAEGFGDKVLEMQGQVNSSASQVKGTLDDAVKKIDQEADKAR